MALVSAPILARALGPDGRGVLSALLSIGFILPVALTAGTLTQVRRMFARSMGSGTLKAARRWSWCGFLVAVPAGAITAWLFVGSTDRTLFVLIAAYVATAPCTVFWMLDGSALAGTGRYAKVMWSQVLPQALYVTALAGAWIGGYLDLQLVLVLTIVLNVFSAAFSHYLLGKLRSVRSIPLRGLLRGSRRYWGATLSEAASNRLDQVIALPLLGPSQAGLYAVAVTIGTLPLALAQAMSAKAFRDVILTPAQARPALYAAVSRASALGGVLVAILLAILVPFIVPALFGEDFAGAVLGTLVYLCGSALAVVAAVQSSAMTSTGRGWSVTMAQLGGLVVGVGALLVLGPAWGAAGAALASNLGFLAIVIFLSSRLGLSPSHLRFRRGDGRELRRLLGPEH